MNLRITLDRTQNLCSSSRIFSRRAFSSGVRFFLAICNTSDVVLLFYTTSEVCTKFGMVSVAHVIAMSVLVLNLRKIQCAILQLLAFLPALLSPKQKWAIVQ